MKNTNIIHISLLFDQAQGVGEKDGLKRVFNSSTYLYLICISNSEHSVLYSSSIMTQENTPPVLNRKNERAALEMCVC